jgi:hypothetical protein
MEADPPVTPPAGEATPLHRLRGIPFALAVLGSGHRRDGAAYLIGLARVKLRRRLPRLRWLGWVLVLSGAAQAIGYGAAARPVPWYFGVLDGVVVAALAYAFIVRGGFRD